MNGFICSGITRALAGADGITSESDPEENQESEESEGESDEDIL